MKIRLSDDDRKRYGVDEEWLHFDPALIRVKDVVFLQSIGYRNIPDFWSGLFGREIIENGAFVFETDPDGNPVLDDNELPIPKRGPRDQLAWAALVFLALRRHGAQVEWDTFEYSARGFDWQPDEGKADSEETTTSES